jgi:hypothetical protein
MEIALMHEVCSWIVRSLEVRYLSDVDMWRLTHFLFVTLEFDHDQCALFIFYLETFIRKTQHRTVPGNIVRSIPLVICKFVLAMTEDYESVGLTAHFSDIVSYHHSVSYVVNESTFHIPISGEDVHMYRDHITIVYNSTRRLILHIQSSYRAQVARKQVLQLKGLCVSAATLIQKAYRSYKCHTPPIRRRWLEKHMVSHAARRSIGLTTQN